MDEVLGDVGGACLSVSILGPCTDPTSSESQVCASTTQDHRAEQYRPDAVSPATAYISTSLTLTRRQTKSYDAMKVALDKVEAFMQDVEKACPP